MLTCRRKSLFIMDLSEHECNSVKYMQVTVEAVSSEVAGLFLFRASWGDGSTAVCYLAISGSIGVVVNIVQLFA
jgi:hypothetical protein